MDISFIKQRPFLYSIFLAGFLFVCMPGRKDNTLEAFLKLPLVGIEQPSIADIPVYLTALGTVQPRDSIVVRTQVDGRLIELLVREGAFVQAGDVLAIIDDLPYKAQVMLYEGQYSKDIASLENARQDLIRLEQLWDYDSTSQQSLDTQRSLVEQLEGAVKSDRGALDSARINFDYCRIKAAIDGRIGLRTVDPGNIVSTSDTNGLFVLTSSNPMMVLFSLPEDSLSKVLTSLQNNTLSVSIMDRWQENTLGTSHSVALDNQIDLTTGTFKLKAQIDQTNELLFPNQFVHVKLLVDTLNQAFLVPTAAVQQNSSGPGVYTLHPDGKTVKYTNVVASMVCGEHTVIAKGIKADDKIVVVGTDKLSDGCAVRYQDSKL